MKAAIIAALVLLAACSDGAQKQHDQRTVDLLPGATPAGPPVRDAGGGPGPADSSMAERTTQGPHRSNRDELDGQCAPDAYWSFPEDEADYCGTLEEACRFACSGAVGCRSDVVMIGGAKVQVAFCPGTHS